MSKAQTKYKNNQMMNSGVFNASKGKKKKRQIGDNLRICLHVVIVTVVSSRFNLLIVFTLSPSSIK